MKEMGTSSWDSPNTDATNITLFTSLPAGLREADGYFNRQGIFGYWLSLSEGLYNTSWSRILNNSDGIIERDNTNKLNGFSIRCLKD